MSDEFRVTDEMAGDRAELERELAGTQLRLANLRLRLFSWKVGLAFIAGIYVGKFA